MSTRPNAFAIATARPTVMRAAKIALVVGTVIALINHGDKMAMGGMDGLAWIKCALTFLVPYAVSTYSTVMAVKERTDTRELNS